MTEPKAIPPSNAADLRAAIDTGPAAEIDEDLSQEIALSLEREPGDHVTCRRIVANKYRCNWWSPRTVDGYDNPAIRGILITTHRVRRSEFVEVTRTGERLLITAK
jgi:hypothetical protein